MGIGSFVGDLWDDISDIPGDIVDHFESVIEGPGGIVGLLVLTGGIVFVGNPGLIIQGTIAAAEITNAIVKTRKMNKEERTLAKLIFGNSLPSFDKIVLSNIHGKDDRAFVIPNLLGESIINLGFAYEDPIRYTNRAYQEFGQVLIHELTHVWQIHNVGLKSFICAVQNQIVDGTYDPGDGSKSWAEYNPEQQGTIVDRWYAGKSGQQPCSIHTRYYHHINDTINFGNKPPVVQTMSVRNMALSKFDEKGGFVIKSMFPKSKNQSLRKRLIGLK